MDTSIVTVTTNDIDIYVINLDKDADRLADMTHKLQPNNFSRIEGIYGNETDFTNHSDIFITSRYLAPKSALGCALSHRKAAETFLHQSEKSYALVLEDDANPVNSHFMEEVVASIANAPSDWEIIKLDYLPNFNMNTYSRIPSVVMTAYILNKNSARTLLNRTVYYHIDIDLLFSSMVIYNNPTIVFRQQWARTIKSNNQVNEPSINPFSYIHPFLNFKALRIFDYNILYSDLIFFLVIGVLFIYYYEMVVDFFRLDALTALVPSIPDVTSEPLSIAPLSEN
jgi:GR25 family glycosyltransferase involved in LPS biosynthesis